jgi:hypothetical protein
MTRLDPACLQDQHPRHHVCEVMLCISAERWSALTCSCCCCTWLAQAVELSHLGFPSETLPLLSAGSHATGLSWLAPAAAAGFFYCCSALLRDSDLRVRRRNVVYVGTWIGQGAHQSNCRYHREHNRRVTRSVLAMHRPEHLDRDDM